MSCIRMAKMPVESEGRESFWASFHCVAYAGHWILLRHGLRTPNVAFFHRNPKLLSLGRQFGQIYFGAFGVLPLYLNPNIIWDWDLNLGRKEIRDSAIVRP